MPYTIGQVSEKMNITIHTLRYYDNEGLLPFIERSESGRRIFNDRDIILLNTIECLKKTGMSIKDIKQYVDWCVEGFSSVPQRLDLMIKRKKDVENHIAELQKMLDTINHKCEFYQKALETGSTDMCESERDKWVNDILLLQDSKSV